MLAVEIITIAVLAFALVRWLDRKEAEQNRISDLEWARRDAARAELDLLNDGSWGAFLAEQLDHTPVSGLRSAA